jgi:hypothetical protein
MSGTWALRAGEFFIPLQFAAIDWGPPTRWESMGNLSKAWLFPQGPIPGSGVVTATGSIPQALVVPRHRFVMNAGAAVPVVGLTTSCARGCGPLLVPPAVSSTQWGFPATTGTVLAQQTTGTADNDFFTVMGSDMRTLLGAGNISLVVGGLTRRNTSKGPTSYAMFQKVWMTLAAPTPSLTPAGIAAAAALMLLAVGYAMRRGVGR